MRFRNYLNKALRLCEAPIQVMTDAPFEEVGFDRISDISKRGMGMNFKLLKHKFIQVNKENLDLYVSKEHPYYLVGRFYMDKEDTERFAVIFDMSLSKNKLDSKNKILKNKPIERVETVHTAIDYRFNKIASTVYKEIMKNSILISDGIQYQGAVQLWKTFIKDSSFSVYIYDIVEDKIISKVTKNSDVKSIWSDDISKHRIRLIGMVG